MEVTENTEKKKRNEGNLGKILTRYLSKAIETARKGASKKSLCPLSLRLLCIQIIFRL